MPTYDAMEIPDDADDVEFNDASTAAMEIDEFVEYTVSELVYPQKFNRGQDIP